MALADRLEFKAHPSGVFLLRLGSLECTMNADLSYRHGCQALMVIFWKGQVANVRYKDAIKTAKRVPVLNPVETIFAVQIAN